MPHPDPTSSAASREQHGLPSPYLLCGLFLLAMLPLAAWYLVHHPDERHYTDAGIAMVQSGDWLTPRRPDGSLRFNKPILPYWCVAASYSIFGINPFASRLPFLLAGCASVWMTYQLGRLVGNSEAAGRWAALVAVSNLQLVLAATRSIPDILLCLFTTISCWGVLSLVVYQRRNWKTYAAAYVGLGLAIASKGIPAVIVVGSVAGCAILYGKKWNDLRRWLHVPTMALGVFVAVGWFVAMYLIHGDMALSEFAHDQVGARFEASLPRQTLHVGMFLAWCAIAGLPWIVPLVVARLRGRFSLAERKQRIAIVSLGCAVVVLAIAASFCNVVSSRYIVPVVPLLAVWLGSMLAVVERGLVERTLRWLLLALCGLLSVVGIALTAANLQTSHPWLAGGCAVAFGVMVCWIIRRNLLLRATQAAVDFGLVKLAVYPAVCIGLFAFLTPDQGESIVGRFPQIEPLGQQVELIGKPALAGKMRVFDHGHTSLASLELPKANYASPHDTLFIAEQSKLQHIDLRGFQLSDFPSGIGRLKEREVLRALCRGELGDYLDKHQKRCYLAVRQPLPSGTPRVARRSIVGADGNQTPDSPGTTE